MTMRTMASTRRNAHQKLLLEELELEDELEELELEPEVDAELELELLEDPMLALLLELDDELTLELEELELLELDPGHTSCAAAAPWHAPWPGSAQAALIWRDAPQGQGGADCAPSVGVLGTMVSHEPALTLALPVITLPSAMFASVKFTLVQPPAVPETIRVFGGFELSAAKTGDIVMEHPATDWQGR